jgi:type IV pilus assembly protein PilE
MLVMQDKKINRQNGFTLVELMIVIAIIGILTAIAFPSYQNYLKKSRREDAKGALMGLANAMERHFTETNSYEKAAVNNANIGKPRIYSATSPIDGDTAYYDLRIKEATKTTYTIRATPISSSAQKNDGFLELKHTDSKGGWDRNNSGPPLESTETSWD